MNITEFAALKAGDKISNLMAGSYGEVVEVTDQGVKVCWTSSPGKGVSGASMSRAYTANTTAWMHWDVVGPEAPVRCEVLTTAEVADKVEQCDGGVGFGGEL